MIEVCRRSWYGWMGVVVGVESAGYRCVCVCIGRRSTRRSTYVDRWVVLIMRGVLQLVKVDGAEGVVLVSKLRVSVIFFTRSIFLTS